MRDESYEAGFRAGHLQGWLDAMAKLQAPVRPDSAPSEALGRDSAGPERWEAPMPARATVPAPPPVPVTGVQVPLTPASPMMPPHSPASSYQASPETPPERQARREKRDRQNINITLYVASLLLVAAAALFIGTSLPPTMRFAGVCTVTALFYGAGFVLHARVPRLRPAAVPSPAPASPWSLSLGWHCSILPCRTAPPPGC